MQLKSRPRKEKMEGRLILQRDLSHLEWNE